MNSENATGRPFGQGDSPIFADTKTGTVPAPATDSRETARLERVRRFVTRHAQRFVGQGTVVAGWRSSGGRRLGPYYRLAYRHHGRQRSIYLGKSEGLAETVRRFLAALHEPLRVQRGFQRLQAAARASLRASKDLLRQHLAPLGLRLKGFEFRGLDACRRATRWGQLARQLGLPCPRRMPLPGFG